MKVARFFVYLGLAINSVVLIGITLFFWHVALLFLGIDDGTLSTDKDIASEISTALAYLYFWGFNGSCGLLITFIAVISSKLREKWLFWVTLIFSLIYLFIIPIGTIIGIIFIIFLIFKRKEFFNGMKIDATNIIHENT